ncbi:lysylphosphatidylglycerol synthase domain-containing protein [Pontimicrobium aquaticum]|uniref:Lysylphosphatidylglycerol synthase TM region n=1 Tax=Pontimicrobium aquaticum TaxID=2565367 RepID=A0A4U0F0G3_9FLAO|nr:lysylphosphatidylglycerol synthase domain-containing protein [Pontimicrobium aquaticum]TJY37901.1 hypothetical protein E5167_01195 [Pontimicrobium aquaticum]
MISRIPYKTKQFFFVLIKLSIVVGAAYFIYDKLVNNKELDFLVFVDFLVKNGAFSLKNIIFLLVLTIFNWFFEILKWQNLVKSITQISFLEAFKQSLASHTASLFTPNRIGDYAAKTIYFRSDQRKKIVLLNLIGNMVQMSITLLFGIVGFYIFISQYEVDISYYKLVRLLTYALIGVVAIGFGVSHKRFSIKGFSFLKIWTFVRSVSAKIHLKNIAYSLFRYLIFSFQFYYLYIVFGVDITYINAMVLICTMYLLVSIIPTIFIFDVIVKGSVALYIFGFVEINNITILSVTTLMWLLNFVLPSVFGSYYVLNFNLPTASNIDD